MQSTQPANIEALISTCRYLNPELCTVCLNKGIRGALHDRDEDGPTCRQSQGPLPAASEVAAASPAVEFAVVAAVVVGLAAVAAVGLAAAEAAAARPAGLIGGVNSASPGDSVADWHWSEQTARVAHHLSARDRLAASLELRAEFARAVAAGVAPAGAYRLGMVAAGLLAPRPAAS